MASASEILSAIAPQFDSNVNRATHLNLATNRTSSSCFGKNYNYAIALRAAHSLTLSERALTSGGASGSITGKKEGDLSISFGSTRGNNNGDLSQTSYGMELKGLIDGNIISISVIGNNTLVC